MSWDEFQEAFESLKNSCAGEREQARAMSNRTMFWNSMRTVPIESFRQAIQTFNETRANPFFPTLSTILVVMEPVEQVVQMGPTDKVPKSWLESIKQKFARVGVKQVEGTAPDDKE